MPTIRQAIYTIIALHFSRKILEILSGNTRETAGTLLYAKPHYREMVRQYSGLVPVDYVLVTASTLKSRYAAREPQRLQSVFVPLSTEELDATESLSKQLTS